MKALISPNEIFTLTWVSSWEKNDQNIWQPNYSEILDCQRIAQVEPDASIFPLAAPLHWVDCPDDCIADLWYFKDNQVYIKPQDEPQPE